jgi:beta-phosphoglucomutase-like phosphatase (HAD superfamily)
VIGDLDMWQAVFWDLDGTLVHTGPIWMAAERELAAEHGSDWTRDDGLALVGLALTDTGVLVKERLKSDLSGPEIIDYLVERVAAHLQDDVPWMPGAFELAHAFADVGVPQALVTMSYDPIAKAVAEHLPFDALVTGNSVVNGKPHPEAFLLAAELLGADPAQTLAIEDSITGVASAAAAGCHVLAVPEAQIVPVGPDRVVHPTLSGLTPASTVDLFG